MFWKLLWQIVFILGIFAFIVMFFVFSIKGFKDLILIIKGKGLTLITWSGVAVPSIEYLSTSFPLMK